MAAVCRFLNGGCNKFSLSKKSLIISTTTTPSSLCRWKSCLSSTLLNQIENQNQSNLNTQCANDSKINVGFSKTFTKRSASSNSKSNNDSIASPLSTPITTKSTLLKNNLNTIKGTQNMGSCSDNEPNINVDNINPNFIAMEYAVRGPLVIRAGQIEKELKAGEKKPFDQVIRANIGDAHAMGQRPITFLRQVLALTIEPTLLESPNFPEDAKKRAVDILKATGGCSCGSYTDSAGIELIRHQVAAYIEKRDGGIKSDWNNIILTAGATSGIKGLLSLLNCKVDGKKPGIMVPIPQYPLYSATISEYGMNLIDYYLNESKNWGLDPAELDRALEEGNKKSNVRAICVINPGNPTGQVLVRENIEQIIKFAHCNNLLIFADEVYQDNIYDKNSKFFSFKKVMMEMGEPYNKTELASFMSTSKGFLGECGIRGGYMEILNLCPKVRAILLKSISASLCPTTAGQIVCSVMVNPPKEGEPSYEQYIKEKKAILGSLKERAELIYKTFNSFEGFCCNPVQGAMYAFPQIKLPQKAVEAAKKAGQTPDTFYAFDLLETSGICIVPGSGFGQEPGTYHFRTTILPQTDKLKIMLAKFEEFHKAFLQKYK